MYNIVFFVRFMGCMFIVRGWMGQWGGLVLGCGCCQSV